MKVEMVMPQMGESITEATISKWRKAVGASVTKDEIILDISTDKVDSEIPSPASGTILELRFEEGAVVPVKQVIAVIDTEGVGAGAPVAAQAPVQAPVQQQEEKIVATPAQAPAPAVAQVSPASHNESNSSGGRFLSTLVRSLAESRGISLAELESIQGSGRGGRISKQDLLDYIDRRGQSAPVPVPAAPAASQALSTPPAPLAAKTVAVDMPSGEWSPEGVKVVPMDNMRQLIADHMVRSKHTSPHVCSVQEVDCSRISAWRAKHKAEFQKKEGFGLSFTPFFLEAAVRGLLEFPYVNASVDGKKILLKKNVNLGCAVALGTSGLIVPVIKRAEERNLVGLARALNDLALRARNKKLLPDEVSGGTFTVTNPGVFGTIIGTPIINQPQVAILCLGAIKKRPVVVDDMIAIREICYLTLSYDHRIIDGSMGGQYLAFLREYLENWDLNRSLY